MHLSTPGTVRFDGNEATLVFERFYDFPVERVWRALTDPEELRAWYMAEATHEGRTGGEMRMTSGPSQFQSYGKILTWDPPHVLEYEWKIDPRQALPNGEDSIVRWELKREGTGTLLTLTHSKLTRGTAIGFAPGTHAFLDRLNSLLAGEPLGNWMARYDEVKGHYPAWGA